MKIIDLTPFFKALLYVVILPFILSLLTQLSAQSNSMGRATLRLTSWLPVPFMAFTFFVVIASQIRGVTQFPEPVYSVIPIYVLFAVIAPFIGFLAARIFKVDAGGVARCNFFHQHQKLLSCIALSFLFTCARSSFDRCSHRDTNNY